MQASIIDVDREEPEGRLMKLTINKIAEMAQVSKGTVSKALNGVKGVSPATRERILALTKMLDFQPDASARALAMQKTNTLGLLIPHESDALSEHFWPALLSGISGQATRLGMNLMVITPEHEGDIKGTIHRILKSNSVDGLIIGSDMLDKESYSRMTLSGLPFVLIGQNPAFQHYCVDVDSRQGTALIMNHLLSKGYRKIAALLGPEDYPYNRERKETYEKVLTGAGITWRAVGYSEYHEPETRVALNKLLDQHPDLDCLFVGAGGQFLLDALQALKTRGVNFETLGMGTYDNYNYLDYMDPKISAVKQPTQAAGAAAVKMLVGLIGGEEPAEKLLHLENELVIR